MLQKNFCENQRNLREIKLTDINNYGNSTLFNAYLPQLRPPKIRRNATDGCQFFYECENCKTVLRPKSGDCCVYCSYGTVKCPSKQGE
ncbi:MAG: GDCCVxC domain-containing (seleno)protein [Mariniphaga sp.]